MIHEVEGDILLSDAAVIAHGVAPNDDFHQGLALSLRERWPAMYKDFRHWCHQSARHPGEAWSWGGAGGERLVALLTQEPPPKSGGHPGRAKRKHVNHALKAFRAVVEEEGYESVALPKLATGVGGLEWDEVQPLIQHHLGDLGVPVYVYTTYQKGVKATEDGV